MLLEWLIFLPDRHVPAPPAGVEERWITTEDGIRIHAWRAGGSDVGPVLVWSHGNAGNIANRADVLLALAERGLGVLAYDYRGYGKSAGRPSEEGVHRDAVAAYDSERAAGTEPTRIVCFGESIGGAVSIRLATARPCAGVAVVSPFTTLQAVARVHYGPLAALVRGRFDSVSRVKELSVPLFVAHGDADEIVPFELGEALFAAAHEPKEFVRVPGAAHNDMFLHDDLLDAVADFARRVASR
jgi:hypothetical protein